MNGGGGVSTFAAPALSTTVAKTTYTSTKVHVNSSRKTWIGCAAVAEPAVTKGVSRYEGGRERRRSADPQMAPRSCAATYSRYLCLPNLQEEHVPPGSIHL